MLEFLLQVINFFTPTPGVPFWGYITVALFRCFCVLQWGLICLICLWSGGEPAAGARDGMGMFFVWGGKLFFGSIIAFLFYWVEAWLIGLVIPDFPEWLGRVNQDELERGSF